MVQKVFLTRSGNANFICPECGKTRPVDVNKFKDVEKEVRLKCTCTSCKHVFPVLLERRQHIRMAVDLEGSILLGEKKYPVKVMNISRYGIRVRTRGALDLKLLDQITVEFVLDDSQQSNVRKEVIIRTMFPPEYGLEFVEKDHYDKLGPYLLFHFS